MADIVNNNLFSDFPSVTSQQWMDKVTADLKGADFDKKLVWKTNEGFSVKPFYRQEDISQFQFLGSLPGEFPYVRGTQVSNEWFVRQDIVVENAIDANLKALDVLMKGVNSINFVFDDADLISKENIGILLKDFDLTSIEVNFNTPRRNTQLVEFFVEYVKNEGVDPLKVTGSVNIDPIGKMLCSGKMHCDKAFENIAACIATTKHLPLFRVIGINGVYTSNAGATISQELGYSLALATDYLSLLNQAGVSAYDIASNIKFNFGVSANYFIEIAKFRAARMLWAKIVEQFNPKCECSNTKNSENILCLTASKMIAHAETTEWNMTVYDPYVNMLRSQTEAMSAALGGVHSLTVHPFDKPFKKSDTISERIARNQQLLLKEESNFDKITDAAGGSYYIESLTAEVASMAWSIFLSVEEAGGFKAAVVSGKVQENIAKTSIARKAAISSRREILLGTNQYPNINESVKNAIEKSEEKNCGCCCNPDSSEVVKLDFSRGSEAFETLRLSTENGAKRPKVFMLKVGNVAMRQARAQFSANFFGCAGYEIIENLGYATVAEGVAEALAIEANIVVICSSDDEYATMAVDAKNSLGKKAIFVVAGAPACTEELKSAGIENFIHVKSNVLDELVRYNQLLGI